MLVHLVRHGPPVIDSSNPAATWPLDPEQIGEVDRLCDSGVLPRDGADWFTSTEPKARQTADRLYDGTVHALEDLREAERPVGWFERREFVAMVVRSLEHPDVPAYDDWETTQAVRVRTLRTLGGAISREVAKTGACEIVLVGHGTAWTVLVASVTDTPPDLAAWQAMTMPDHCTLELTLERDDDGATPRRSAGKVVTPWGSWRTS